MNPLWRGIKNAFRNMIRSVGIVIILAVAIALSISMLIARDAVTKKIDTVRSSTGNTITVTPKGFFGFQGGGTPLTESELSKVAALDHVTAVRESLGERLTTSQTSLKSAITPGSLGHQFGGGGNGFGGNSSSSGSTNFSIPITFTGTNSPSTALTGGANGGGTETLVSGTTFSPSSTQDVAIVGQALASKNNLKVGSTFTAWGTSIKVIGIYSAGSTFANSGVLMPLQTVQTLAGATGQVTNATVVVDSVDNVSTVSSEITKTLGSAADVTSTQQTIENQLSPLNSVKTISTYSLIGAVIAAAIILLLSMVMIVRERRREIGVLKAIGASNKSVVGQFISESLTFTVLGSVVGLVFGIILSNPITSMLVSSSSSSSGFGGGGSGPGGFFRPGGGTGGGFAGGPPGGGFHFGGFHSTLTQVHAAVSVSTFLFAFLIAILIAVVGSSLAVANVVRIRPAEVLRSE
jgi:putative ABC transport system permease protein